MIAATLAAACVVAGDSAALARDRDGGLRGEGQHSWSAHPHGFSRGQKVGWHGKLVPPGWFKGRKTGWFKDHKSGWNEHHAPHGLHSEMDDDHQD